MGCVSGTKASIMDDAWGGSVVILQVLMKTWIIEARCNRTRQRPGPDNDHTIWSFSGPEISGPDNDHLGLDNDQSLCGPKISGPENDVGKIVRSLSGPETPGLCICDQKEFTLLMKTKETLRFSREYIRCFHRLQTPRMRSCIVFIKTFLAHWSKFGLLEITTHCCRHLCTYCLQLDRKKHQTCSFFVLCTESDTSASHTGNVQYCRNLNVLCGFKRFLRGKENNSFESQQIAHLGLFLQHIRALSASEYHSFQLLKAKIKFCTSRRCLCLCFVPANVFYFPWYSFVHLLCEGNACLYRYG